MSKSTDAVIERWVGIETGRARNTRSISSSNCFFTGPVIYSYGTHFPMARALKDDAGTTVAFLVNGDTWSITTSRQQASVRSATQGSGLPTVIVPFSVLRSAGIDERSVRILDVTPDTHDVVTHTSEEMLPGWRWRRDPVREYVDLGDDEVQAMVDKRNAAAREELERRRERYRRAVAEDDQFWINLYKDVGDEEPRIHTRDDIPYHQLREWRTVGHKDRLYANGFYNRTIDVHDGPDGRWYSWETRQHWLGESLIEAAVTWTQFIRCRACKGTGRRAPARARVPIAEVGIVAPDDGDSTWVQHDIERAGRCGTCNGRGGRWVDRSRRARFLSGFDRNETQRSYFFCELPPGTTATTVTEAYEALKPDPVKLAEGMGRDVKRQGDIFAVELRTLDKRSLRKAGATFERRGNLLGTNHVATEVARMPDGTLLARGTLTHAPEFRRPDHRRVPLGTAWHVIVKNTVPAAA